MQKLLIGHQVIMIEIVAVKERGLRPDPSFTSPAETSTDNAIIKSQLLYSVPPKRKF